jgi:outer membrane protein TolC
LEAKYRLKNLLLSAENTYWSLVSLNQVIKLQEENVDRSRKLRDLMRNKAKLRLVDDVDALQAQAALESRELELQSSLDDRSAMVREMNTMRGQSQDVLETLAELPEKDWAKVVRPGLKITREDFEVLRQEAEMARSQARAGVSHVQPQLDLVGNFSANSIDPQSGRAYDEVARNEHETWYVGLKFSMALDIGLIHSVANSFRAQKRVAADLKGNAEYSLERTYAAISAQHGEAQRRYERAVSLEKVQTELVKRERQRLLNGRTTTFQTITFEQNLASSQVQKVKAQLALLQLHNVLKTFTEQQ